MDNALYYTFSTIAQALGGAFGFLSAFVLYRFQSLNRAMEQDAVPLRGLIDDKDPPDQNVQFEFALAQGKFHLIVAWLHRKVLPASRTLSPEQFAALYRMRLSIAQQRGVLLVFWIALWVTAAVMAWSVWAIPRAHDWASDPEWAARAMYIGGGAFAVCLLLYLAVIWACVTTHLSWFEKFFKAR